MKKLLSTIIIFTALLTACKNPNNNAATTDDNAVKVEVEGDKVNIQSDGAGVKVDGENVKVEGDGSSVVVKDGKVEVTAGDGKSDVEINSTGDTKAISTPSGKLPQFDNPAVQKWVNNFNVLHQDLKAATTAGDVNKVTLITNKISIEAPKIARFSTSLNKVDAKRLEEWADNLE